MVSPQLYSEELFDSLAVNPAGLSAEAAKRVLVFGEKLGQAVCQMRMSGKRISKQAVHQYIVKFREKAERVAAGLPVRRKPGRSANPSPALPNAQDLVSVTQFSFMLGVSDSWLRKSLKHSPEKYPTPVASQTSVMKWHRSDVERFLAERLSLKSSCVTQSGLTDSAARIGFNLTFDTPESTSILANSTWSDGFKSYRVLLVASGEWVVLQHKDEKPVTIHAKDVRCRMYPIENLVAKNRSLCYNSTVE